MPSSCARGRHDRIHRPGRHGRAHLPQPRREERREGPRPRSRRGAACAIERPGRRGRGLGTRYRRALQHGVPVAARRCRSEDRMRGAGQPHAPRALGKLRRRPQHHDRGAGARSQFTLRRERRALRRCADRPHPRSGGEGHALRDGGQHRAGVHAHPRAARPHRHRHHALRRAGRRAGDQAHQQHGALPERGGARGSALACPPGGPQRHARVRDPRQGLGRQLRPAPSRLEGHGAGQLPGARLLGRIRAQGPRVRARVRQAGARRASRGAQCQNTPRARRRRRPRQEILPGARQDPLKGVCSAVGLPSACMDFELTPEQGQFRDAVLGFSKKHLAAGARERAHAPGYPWDVAGLMAKQGLLGITLPQADGGQGGSLMDALIAIETVASVCPRSADVVQAGNFGPIRVLAEYGSDFQKKKFLQKLLAGEAVISVGMTEPEAGSAVTDLKTTATPDGDGYRINGSKIFMTHSAYAEVILAYVRFGPGVAGIGSVLIQRGSKGVRSGKPSKFMSGEEWTEIHFEDVRVPREMVLLAAGGFKKQMAGFNVERIGNAARSLALGRYAFERARAWALARRQFGRLLAEFQGLQWKFADMKMQLDAAQLLLYRAAANADRGMPSAEETAIAKAYCNRAGFDVANESLQVMGGLGYSQEELVEYCVRRCRGWMIAGGSIDILKNRIAEAIFQRSFSQRPDK